MNAIPSLPKFPLGQVVATRGAFAAIPETEMMQALSRHAHGDWGNMDFDDAQENELSLKARPQRSFCPRSIDCSFSRRK